MFWKKAFFYVLFLASIALAADDTTTTTTTSSASKTLVWVTGTNSLGLLTTTQSAYTQTFASVFVAAVSPMSGSIGLGSLDASGVGDIRSYETITVSAAAPPSQKLWVPGGEASYRSIRIITLATLTLVSSLMFL
ncbi:hypothetical protein G9P44_005998 [Scheffersomyces stipitis]|nr:hypothetical protein G9P44_005998 [Scheffersomyces stipitis]